MTTGAATASEIRKACETLAMTAEAVDRAHGCCSGWTGEIPVLHHRQGGSERVWQVAILYSTPTARRGD